MTTTPMAPDISVPLEDLKRRPTAAHREAAKRSSSPSSTVDVRALWAALRRAVEGEVRFDQGTRGLYAQDASNYLHVPLGVVIPKTRTDVLAVLAACERFQAPIVARTGGTSLAGQAANEAVVIDFSKYMHHILDFDPRSRLARVEPGVICDQLANTAVPHGLTWGPQPATHNRCCFGGMLANNCGGMRAQQAGIAVHHVEALEIALYGGTNFSVGWMDEAELARRSRLPGREGQLFAELHAFRERYAELIRTRMPQLPRRVSGYNLDELLPKSDGRFNLARALVGSEGTCITMLEATLHLVEYYPQRVVVAIGYDDVVEAGDHVPTALEYQPLAAEGMDQRLYEHVIRKHMPQQKFLDILPKGRGWLLVELGSHDKAEAVERAQRLIAALEASSNRPRDLKLITDPEQQQHLWNVREAGLGATAFVPGSKDAWPGFEDSAVPPEQIGPYLRDLRALFDRYGYEPSLYGHFGMGCVHCRVDFDLVNARGIAHWRKFMDDAADLVAVKYRGSLSGEHGDGQARGELLVKMFGHELVQAFREFKSIWDPSGKMNPGRVVDARPITADLRLGASYDPQQPKTHFQFPEDGGSFAHATLRCVGVGKCRRLQGEGEQDTMCPSFMVTREEKHSTRGRAHLLWEMLRGDGTPVSNGFKDENVKEALDLCLSCKGCKGDCPVNVDVATYKAEFLSHYYEGRVRPRHAYAFGLIDRWARIGGAIPGLTNFVTQSPSLSQLAKFVAGMAPERQIPEFAPQTFRAWFAAREAPSPGREKVLLFPDTFNNYFYPDTARAAVEVLEHLGFEVTIPDRVLCCGRPLYDYGMLDRAKQYLQTILRDLRPHIDAGTPMLVLEPSCCAVFRDELPNLMPSRVEARRLTDQTLSFSEFIARRAGDRVPKLRRRAIVQGHCHHKAIMRMSDEKRVLADMGLQAELLESGCCGMAGSFGFEAGKYQVSQACGERALLPRVRSESPETLIIADGFSCRTQIAQGSERNALHLAQVMRLAIEHGAEGPAPTALPEAEIVAARKAALERSQRRTRLALLGAGALLTVTAVSFAIRRRS